MAATVIAPRAITAPPSKRGTVALLSIASLIAVAILQGRKVLAVVR